MPSYVIICGSYALLKMLFLAHRVRLYCTVMEHITPILRDLHWLRYPKRIDFKLAMLVYRYPHGLAPRYLSDYIQRVADSYRRCFRSSSSSQLVIRRTRPSTVGDRVFPVLSNGLPCDASHINSNARRLPRTHASNHTFYHPRNGVIIVSVECVCLCVCPFVSMYVCNTITFERFSKFIFGPQVHLQGIWVKFVAYIRVIGSKSMLRKSKTCDF